MYNSLNVLFPYIAQIICNFVSNSKVVFVSSGDSASWVLPFTSGGFIYIALVTIVPELLEEQRPWYEILIVGMYGM